MLFYSIFLKKNGKKYILFLTVICIFLFNLLVPQTLRGQTVTLDELKAFPTAEGFGKQVTGGKDGILLKVTNLNDRGSGSLRASLEDDRAATIVFEVAGTILLNSFMRPKSNKTIAGETAFRNGGQGITIRMNPNRLYADPLVATGGRAHAFGNHIWRYIRFRRGQGVSGESSGDNFSPWGNAGRFIIDHCSFMFSTDQNVSFPSVDGYTVQNSITAFGLAYATHAYGTKHSKGSLTSDTPYCSWYRNLFSCNDDRNPLIQARSTGITRIELINNFFYNRGIFGVQLNTFSGGTFHADIIGNYWKDGPNSNRARYGIIWPAETTAEAAYPQYYRNTQWANQRVHVAGNLSPRRTSHSQDDWDVLGRWDDSRNAPLTSKNQHQVLTRLHDGVSNNGISAAEDLQSDLLSDVGVSLYYDSFDSQAISFAINGTGSIFNGNGYSGQNFPQVSTLGPHPNLQDMSVIPTDTNNDGIADDWASTHAISNSNQVKAIYDFENYQVINNAGYTALEIYLAYLAKDFDRMDQGNETTAVAVTGLDIDIDALTLTIQETASLTATITPSNATNQNVTWSSSDTAIATVDQSGNITAVTPGNVTITATSVANNGIYDTATIVVEVGEPTELWLEAECANVGANWTAVNDASASGNRYLLPPIGNNPTEVPSDTGSVISFDVTASASSYAIYARTLTPNGADDSFWIRVNGGTWLIWNQIPNNDNFEWNQVHDGNDVNAPLRFNFAEGNNTLEIAHREDGAGLDKIFITNTATTPNGFGQADDSCLPDILVESITLNPELLELEINEVQTLTATIAPANATNQSITWSSSDNTIATVDQNGNITAIAEGNATISATANDDSNTGHTSLVTVNTILLDTIAIIPEQLDLEINQVRTLVTNKLPANATDQSVTWSSSNSTIATVDQNGNVTAVAEGTATITAMANDASNTSGVSLISVSATPAQEILVTDVTLTPQEITLEISQVQMPTVAILPTNATNQSITWSSSDTMVATVDQSGNITAIAEGSTAIIATANDSSDTYDVILVNVNTPDILIDGITLNPQELILEVTQTQNLTTTISPVNATNQSVTWSSNNTTVASVDQNGNVTAIAEGSATITVTSNDGSGTYDAVLAYISAAPAQDILVDGITLTPLELNLEITQVQTLAATIVPANATDQRIAWSSSDTTVATVDQNGNVTAIAEGSATISALANDGSGTNTAAQVNVSAAIAETILVEDITINPQQIDLEFGQVRNLSATVLPTNATDGSITWASSDTTVATVDQNGNVTAVGGGSTTITATANDFGSVYNTAQVTVNGGHESEITELWLEAECANVGSNWDIMEDTSASGGKYLLPPPGNNYDTVPTDNGSIIAYDFTLEKGGTYSIYARALTPTGSDDSFWVRLNGGAWLLWNQIPRDTNFEWNRIHDGNNANLPLIFTFVEGYNTLEIAHREDGAGLDKVFITNSTNVPNGLGLTDAACISEDDTDLISPVGLSGLDQNEALEKTTVYPNPTRSNTLVTFSKEANYAFFSLYSINGVLIKQGKIENNQNSLSLNMADMDNGMYLLRLFTGMGEETFEKIIKE